jgi:hypothetical protein
MANMGAGEYHDFECRENSEKGGCDCDFYIAEAAGRAPANSASTAVRFARPPVPSSAFTAGG